MRGAAGDVVEAAVVAGAQLQGDLGEVDLSGLMFLEGTPLSNSDESRHVHFAYPTATT